MNLKAQLIPNRNNFMKKVLKARKLFNNINIYRVQIKN